MAQIQHPIITARQEQQLCQDLEHALATLLKHLSVLGLWSEFIRNLLHDLSSGRETPRGILVQAGSLQKLTRAGLATRLLQRARRMAAAQETVDAAFYLVQCEPALVGYCEPGCTESPLIYALERFGGLTVRVDPSLTLPSSARTALEKFAQAQEALAQMLVAEPLYPHYSLDRAEEIEGELQRYRATRLAYQEWQIAIARQTGGISDEEWQLGDAQYRASLFATVRGFRLLPADVDRQLGRVSKCLEQVNWLRGQILMCASRNVTGCAQEHAYRAERAGVSVEDMEAEGHRGLMRAISSFDWRRGNRFGTYAYAWIRSSIRDFLSESAGAMRIPTSQRPFVEKVRAAKTAWEFQFGVTPTVDQLVYLTGLKASAVRLHLRLIVQSKIVSFDVVTGGAADAADGREAHAAEREAVELPGFSGANGEKPGESLLEREDSESVRKVFFELSTADQLLIGEEHGVFDFRLKSHAVMAKERGLSIDDLKAEIAAASSRFRLRLRAFYYRDRRAEGGQEKTEILGVEIGCKPVQKKRTK
jgi:hypothetical protein